MTKNTFDLDLDPMTLILKLDLNMVKMYLYTENEVPSCSSSKVIAWTDRQTDTQRDRQTDTHRQTHRQTYRQTETQTDTQTDRHTDTQTHRQTGRPEWNYDLSAYADGKKAE